jgi:hypothetical protein
MVPYSSVYREGEREILLYMQDSNQLSIRFCIFCYSSLCIVNYECWLSVFNCRLQWKKDLNAIAALCHFQQSHTQTIVIMYERIVGNDIGQQWHLRPSSTIVCNFYVHIICHSNWFINNDLASKVDQACNPWYFGALTCKCKTIYLMSIKKFLNCNDFGVLFMQVKHFLIGA